METLSKLTGRQPDYGELCGMLRQAGRNVELGTALLCELMRMWPDGREKRIELVDFEHDNDSVTHDVIHHLWDVTGQQDAAASLALE